MVLMPVNQSKLHHLYWWAARSLYHIAAITLWSQYWI